MSGTTVSSTSTGCWTTTTSAPGPTSSVCTFYDAVIDLARHLHADGVIEKIFGRPLPVVVFDMECPGWEAHATEYANPPELVEEFMAWQRAAGEI